LLLVDSLILSRFGAQREGASDLLFGSILTAVLGGLLILASTTTPAFAYLDPGAGSMMLQALLAGVAGSIFALRQYRSRLVSFLKRKPRRRDENDNIAG
jgi:hypothetical protein